MSWPLTPRPNPARLQTLEDSPVPRIHLWDRLVCWFRGHHFVLACKPGELTLRCMACGHVPVGWTTGPHAVRALKMEGTVTKLITNGPPELQRHYEV